MGLADLLLEEEGAAGHPKSHLQRVLERRESVGHRRLGRSPGGPNKFGVHGRSRVDRQRVDAARCERLGLIDREKDLRQLAASVRQAP